MPRPKRPTDEQVKAFKEAIKAVYKEHGMALSPISDCGFEIVPQEELDYIGSAYLDWWSYAKS